MKSVLDLLKVAFRYKPEDLTKEKFTVQCLACGKDIKFGASQTNSNLLTHLKNPSCISHQQYLDKYYGIRGVTQSASPTPTVTPKSSKRTCESEMVKPQAKRTLYSSTAENVVTQMSVLSYCKKTVDDALHLLLVGKSLPFDLVDSFEFKYFCFTLNPHYKLPSESRIKSTIIPTHVIRIEADIIEHLNKCSDVNISLDIWTDRNMRSWIGIKCHAIDSDWKQFSATLGVIRITGLSKNN